MIDFVQLLAKCKVFTAVSNTVMDDFLLNFTARREGLDKEMDQCLTRFRKVTKEIPQNWINLIRAQYVCHRIFKENGLIKNTLLMRSKCFASRTTVFSVKAACRSLEILL